MFVIVKLYSYVGNVVIEICDYLIVLDYYERDLFIGEEK